VRHPSFFRDVDLTGVDGDSRPTGGPSSLSGSAGTSSAFLGGIDACLNDDTPPNNRLGLSSIADKRGTSPHTSDSRPPPKTKKASDSCIPPEAMVELNHFVELLIVAELFV